MSEFKILSPEKLKANARAKVDAFKADKKKEALRIRRYGRRKRR